MVQQGFWNAKYLVNRAPKRWTGMQDKATKYQRSWIYSSPVRGAGKIAQERLDYARVGLTPKNERN